jgi:glycosyltransferase involved in cell wall biosynthesis
MWAFTGGCHYSGACTRYEQTCGNCPQLRSNREFDLSRWTWKRKSKVWADLPLTIVTPSKWLADCVNASSLLHGFRIETIPNGLDMTVYQPHDKQFSRQLHHLPTDKRLILFGALGNLKNERKGSQFLRPALQKLSQMGLRDVELVIVGAEASENAESFGLKTHYVGTLQDDASLSALYAAVDVFVAPSTQDNLPNTVVESLACGTPIVAFDIGGMPDIVDHHETGYLAQPYEADDLAAGIAWVLEDDERRQKLAVQARKVAEERFDIYRAARMYADLYQDILSH